MLPRPLRQESLSKAYVRAVVAKAGLVCSQSDYDFGIDMAVGAVLEQDGAFADPGVYLNLQLKSTTRANVGDTAINYDLDARTYERLRKSGPSNPPLLVVLVMPDDENLWLAQSAEELTMRHCAYWLVLNGHPATQATSSVRVMIPKENMFSVAFVQARMQDLLERSRR